MKKIILIVLLAVVVLLVAGVFIVGSHLGEIIKAGVETAGPKITLTSLKVDSVSVSLLGGSAGVQGLVLGNPEGCQTPHAIRLGKAAIRLSPGSIMSDKVVIHSIEVRDAEIIFEGDPLGANNFAKIMDNVNATTASAAKPDTTAPASTPGEKQSGKKLQVDDMLIAGAKVQAKLTGGVNKDISLTIPDVHLTDLGKGADGITAAELTKRILAQVSDETIKALKASVIELGKDAAQDAANKAVDKGVDKLKKKGLGGLLGK